jgi:hypothetical protein
VPAGLVSVLAMVVLGLLAAALAAVVIPRLFGIAASCVGTQGWQRSSGDVYFDTVMVVGTFGWLAVAVAVIYASIAEQRGVVFLLPLAWFGALVVLAVTLAAFVGPATCAP